MSKTSGHGGEAKPKTEKQVRKKKVATKKVAKKKVTQKKVVHKKPPPASKKRSGKKIQTFLIAALFLAGLVKLTQVSLDVARKNETTKQYALLISALDKLFFGCTVYWSGEGRGEDCSQDVWKRIAGHRFDEIEVTILKGQQYEFTAQARHSANDKVFQVDHKGAVYLNVDDCLAKVTFNSLSLENIQALEKQCPTKNP
ncbi:MAG: hypothetical protein ACE5G9_12815 [Nitrospinales bacterium]